MSCCNKADIGLSGERPVHETLIGTFLGVLRICLEMRRVIGTKKFPIAHEHEIALGRFDGIGDVSPGFSFLLEPNGQIAP